MKMGFEWGENLLGKFPVRVNSGHPLFIGEGRTGENPVTPTKRNLTQTHFGLGFLYLNSKLIQPRAQSKPYLKFFKYP